MMEETIDKESMEDISDGNPTIISDGIFAAPHKLTPTGKISYAKTRVYTQRYRKEWEQMPDFKGWLTSVPSQPTRAFCTYCKKNLHAHRLSLLKHTCTMKHQRAALLAHPENNKAIISASSPEKASDIDDQEFEEVTVVSAIKTFGNEEDEIEEFEYVVESLDIEEEEQSNSKEDQVLEEEEMESMKLDSHDEDEEPRIKKIKVEPFGKRDTLAQAMAHVHGEYLEQNDEDQEQVELEMIVESENTLILPDKNEESQSGSDERNARIKSSLDNQIKRPIEMIESKQKTTKAIAYKINSSNLSGVNLQGIGTVTLTPSQAKTLTLHNGKTVTLNNSKAGGPGTQYILSKVKGNLPTLLMAGSKAINQRTLIPKSMKPAVLGSPSTSAGAIQEQSKAEIQKGIEGLRNPCISTHVLDTSKGTPVTGLQVSLYKLMDGRWTFLNESTTSGSGRCNDLCNTSKTPFTAGRYKMHFDVDKYFTLRRIETLYPFIEIVFDVKNPTGSYHIPVLLSPFGYTTYRGSDR